MGLIGMKIENQKNENHQKKCFTGFHGGIL